MTLRTTKNLIKGLTCNVLYSIKFLFVTKHARFIIFHWFLKLFLLWQIDSLHINLEEKK